MTTFYLTFKGVSSAAPSSPRLKPGPPAPHAPVKILYARTAGSNFYVWVGKLLRLGDVDYVAAMTSGIGADPRDIKSIQLYHEGFTDLVIVAKGGD
jgi:hypothetical protein